MADSQVVQAHANGGQTPQQSYEYTILADLPHATGKRNVWASVVECSVPRPTKGTGTSPAFQPASLARPVLLNTNTPTCMSGERSSCLYCKAVALHTLVWLADLVSNMTIVDPSILPHEGLEQDAALIDGVSALFFCSDAARLPVVRKQGDLIRFHRAQVSQPTPFIKN